MAVYDKDYNLIQRFEYAYDRVPVSMVDSDGKRYYLHYDQIGSLRYITDRDGNIVKSISYDSFGNITNETNGNFDIVFGFVGEKRQANSNCLEFVASHGEASMHLHSLRQVR